MVEAKEAYEGKEARTRTRQAEADKKVQVEGTEAKERQAESAKNDEGQG
jgi:hypothetical protein